MNCLNSNYKRLIDAALDCDDEEEETNVDQLRPANDKQQADTANNTASASSDQHATAARFEYRTEGKTRILPIKRGGEKQSDTHYFVIPPPVFRVPLDETDSQSHATLNEPSEPCASAQQDNANEQDKVAMVTNTVHGVTDEEAKMALSRSRMNVDEACRYLAVEQLFRLGFSREQSARALAASDGSLEKASAALLSARFPSSANASSTHRSDCTATRTKRT